MWLRGDGMESKIIVANLKMAMSASDTASYLKLVNKNLSKNVIICPSNIYLPYFVNNSYSVGIQNIFFRSDGEFTGEVSPMQAKSIGANYALIGHPERRLYFNETDDIINKKVLECLKNNLKIILCIGETVQDKNLFRTDKVLKKQILNCLSGVKLDKMPDIIIAYEPFWTVDTNTVATNYEIERVIKIIKDVAQKYLKYNNIKVIYGGNIDKDNIKTIMNVKDLDGYLLGRSSCDIEEFSKIIEVVVNQ